jgi:hypothetical protein
MGFNSGFKGLITLEVIETQEVNNNEHGTAVIYMDSKITLDSIRIAKNHNHLEEETRKTAVTLNKKRTGKYILNG